jgi:hypothetical protein
MVEWYNYAGGSVREILELMQLCCTFIIVMVTQILMGSCISGDTMKGNRPDTQKARRILIYFFSPIY